MTRHERRGLRVRGRVERGERLVQKDGVSRGRERTNDLYPAALAAREPADGDVKGGFGKELGKQGAHARTRGLVAGGPHHEQDVLHGGHLLYQA